MLPSSHSHSWVIICLHLTLLCFFHDRLLPADDVIWHIKKYSNRTSSYELLDVNLARQSLYILFLAITHFQQTHNYMCFNCGLIAVLWWSLQHSNIVRTFEGSLLHSDDSSINSFECHARVHNLFLVFVLTNYLTLTFMNLCLTLNLFLNIVFIFFLLLLQIEM